MTFPLLLDAQQAVVGDMADGDGIESPLVKDVVELLLLVLVRDQQHALLRFAEHDFVGRHRCLALRNRVEFQLNAGAAARAHFAARAGQPGGAHVLDADNQALLHGFKTGFEKQLLHERIADLHVGTLGAGIFAESGRGHRRAVNAVAPGLRADIDDGIADAGGAAVEDLVLFENAEGEGVDQRVLRIAAREGDFAADRRNAEAVSVEGDAADDTFHDAAVLRLVQRAEPQAVHRGDGPRAHREDVAKNAAHAGGCALKRLDVGRMIVRLDLERNSQAVADVDDAGVFARALQDGRALSSAGVSGGRASSCSCSARSTSR